MLYTPKIVLEAHGLKRTYGSVVAVDGVSLHAAAGETVGLLGPNGAGKTTTVSIIAGLVHPDAGSVKVWPTGAVTASAASAAG